MLAALLGALLYLALCTHVQVDVRLEANGKTPVLHTVYRAWGVSVYVSSQGGKLPQRRKIQKLSRFSFLVRAALRTLRIGQIDLHTRIGLDDAAATAAVCGAVYAAANALAAISGHQPRSFICVDADFSGPCFVLAARCIFSIIPGDTVFAVVKAAAKKTQKEGFKWLSTPLKA